MDFLRLAIRSLIYHWKINVAVALGVAAATAVLTGALLVGDSVRGSLRDMTLDRLGLVDELLLVDRFFREPLATELANDPHFPADYQRAVGVMLFPSRDGGAAHGRRRHARVERAGRGQPRHRGRDRPAVVLESGGRRRLSAADALSRSGRNRAESDPCRRASGGRRRQCHPASAQGGRHSGRQSVGREGRPDSQLPAAENHRDRGGPRTRSIQPDAQPGLAGECLCVTRAAAGWSRTARSHQLHPRRRKIPRASRRSRGQPGSRVRAASHLG